MASADWFLACVALSGTDSNTVTVSVEATMCVDGTVAEQYECCDKVVSSSIEEDDLQHVQYLRDMVYQYTKHMLWYKEGFVPEQDFMLENVDDMYSNHLYCMSWFYGGTYPFDSWEVEYNDYLRGIVHSELNCDNSI